MAVAQDLQVWYFIRMNKKHIVLVYKDFYPPVKGGIEYHLADIVSGLRGRFDFTVLVQDKGVLPSKEEINGATVIRTGEILRVQSAPISPSLVPYFRRLKPDIWHFHLPNPTAYIAYLLARPRKSRILVTYHSDIVRQKVLGCLNMPLLLAFLNKSQRILATSPQYAKSSLVLRMFKDKVKVLPLGIEPPAFIRSHVILAQALEIKKRLDKPIIVFVGKLRYYKGLPYLLKAMTYIDAHLIIVGDGAMRDELEGQITSLNIKDKVTFEGEVNDERKWAILLSGDVFCLPSTQRSEAFGLAQVEAQLAGLPVVTTEIGTGTTFVTIDKLTGLVVPPCQSIPLAKAINLLLASEELRHKFGEAGRERAEKEFSLSKMIERLEVQYRELLSDN